MRSRFLYHKPRGRHPTDRRPIWLQKLDAEIRYWLTRSAHLRHSEPFNKRASGYQRRQARRLKQDLRK